MTEHETNAVTGATDRTTGRDVWAWRVAAGVLFVVFVAMGWRGFFGRTSADGAYASDLMHFVWAAEAVRAGTDLYESGARGYLYPPLLAVLCVPLTYVPIKWAALVWVATSATTMAFSIRLAARGLCERVLGRHDEARVMAACVVGSLFSFQFINWQLRLQQSDFVALLAFAAGLAWMDRRPVLTGVLLGLACNIKYQTLVALVYLVARGRWRAALAMGGSVIGWALLPALAMGWRGNLDALSTAFSGVARLLGATRENAPGIPGDVTWLRSVSITSAMARLTSGWANGTVWMVVLVMVCAAVCGVAAWVMLWARGVPLLRGRGGMAEGMERLRRAAAFEWLGVVTAALVFSAQTVPRHMLGATVLNVAAALVALTPTASGGTTGRVRLLAIGGAGVFVLGAMLPPGSAGFEGALSWWRAVGGTSWCLLGCFFAVGWGVLGGGRGGEGGGGEEPAAGA